MGCLLTPKLTPYEVLLRNWLLSGMEEFSAHRSEGIAQHRCALGSVCGFVRNHLSNLLTNASPCICSREHSLDFSLIRELLVSPSRLPNSREECKHQRVRSCLKIPRIWDVSFILPM